jgi:hypothetical protein
MNLNKANLIIFFLYNFNINSVSLVYNLKISQTTQSHKIFSSQNEPSIAFLTLVDQFKLRKDGTKEKIFGGLGTLIYSGNDYYLRADFAGGKTKQKIGELCFSKTQSDDVLFSGGISKKFGEKTKFTFSGLFGVPTHKDFVLDPGVQFGTGHFGIGMQTDGSYYYSNNRKNLVLGAARFIYFLPRTLEFNLNNNDLKFDFDLGNLVDLYISHQSFWKKNRFEFGYDVSFAFGASIQPSISNLLEAAKFIRSNFFVTLAHGFLIKEHLAGIILGFSYSFDHVPKVFGYKKILTFWLSGGVNF